MSIGYDWVGQPVKTKETGRYPGSYYKYWQVAYCIKGKRHTKKFKYESEPKGIGDNWLTDSEAHEQALRFAEHIKNEMEASNA